jgi:hypothetical protein
MMAMLSPRRARLYVYRPRSACNFVLAADSLRIAAMSSPLELPETLPRPPRTPRWQFGLWYLFVLTTVVAAIAGAMRFLSDVPWLAVGMGIYVLGMLGYVLLRLPWLVSKVNPERQRVRENRRRLEEWAEQKRRQP